MATRVQRRRTRGWGMPENTIYVGRPSRWGNPYPVLTYGRQGSVERFRKYALDRLDREPDWLDPLYGKDLACWCPLNLLCHADVLLELLKERR